MNKLHFKILQLNLK